MGENEGHRERLRKRFLMSGISGFHDYEVLELLLSNHREQVVIGWRCKYGNIFS